MNAPVKSVSVQYYVDRLTPIYDGMREDVLALGRLLKEAKANLPHGEFSVMIMFSLPFTPEQARMFMRIADNPQLAKHRGNDVLPTNAGTLDELTRVSPERFERALLAREIHPQMTQVEARALRGPLPREPIPVEASVGAELFEPCTGHTDILARMKGYRLLAGMNQLELDERANLQSGYTGKIEVQIKPLTMETMIDDMAALVLKVYILPASARVTVEAAL